MVETKQTLVGDIPSDWNIVSLSKLSTKIGDGIHTTPQYVENGSFFFINGNNLSNGLITLPLGTKMVSHEEAKKHAREISNKTILLSINGTIGNVAQYNNERIILGKSAAYINVNEKIDKNYLFQIFKSELLKAYFDNEVTGTTIQNLGLTALRSAPIPLPPTKAEQSAIATTLNDADALITKLKRLIGKKKAIKQGAIYTLLNPTLDWRWVTLNQLGKTYGGLSGKKKADFIGGSFPYIPFMNIMNNTVINPSFLDYVTIKPWEKQNRVIPGDLLFNGSSETPEEVGMCSVLMEPLSDLYLNSFCFGFRLLNEKEYYNLYLAYYFRSNYGRKLLYNLAQGATRHNLSKSSFLRLEFQVPPYQEQKRIAEVLSDMDAEITLLEKKLEKQKLIKQGMMQVLLTGKVRLL